ncbi:hypothetical protein [Bradyrhizobium sp. DASA03120]|uniref:hypothetical protein n=1 Tax=Bradyrhizobium sp. SMVTL-02 TaxID=3395917 RepID=UPI003F70459B
MALVLTAPNVELLQQGQSETAAFGRATSTTLSVWGSIWTIKSSGEISERNAWCKANHGVDCDSSLMTLFAPSVNPTPCPKYAEEPLIDAPFHPDRRATDLLRHLSRAALKRLQLIFKRLTPGLQITGSLGRSLRLGVRPR